MMTNISVFWSAIINSSKILVVTKQINNVIYETLKVPAKDLISIWWLEGSYKHFALKHHGETLIEVSDNPLAFEGRVTSILGQLEPDSAAVTWDNYVQYLINNSGGNGGSGGNSTLQEYVFPTPALEWVVNHNRGYRPGALIYNLQGNEIEADVFVTETQVTINFSAPTAGFVQIFN